MSKSPVPFAPETLETIQRAFRLATDLRHDTVGLEHLLIAIADEPQARRILVACGADVIAMKRQLEEVLAKAFTPVPASTAVEPEPTLGFDRVIQHGVRSTANRCPTFSTKSGPSRRFAAMRQFGRNWRHSGHAPKSCGASVRRF